MLWLAVHFPHLPIELRQPADEGPVAIVEKRGNRRWIWDENTAARAANAHRGLDVTLALVRQPDLKLIARSLAQEKRALKALAAWAHQWSSEVTFEAERWLLALEIGASVRYFGGLKALRDQIIEGVAALGYLAQIGVAPTWEAAALLAGSPDPATVLHHKDLRAALDPRPLTALAVNASIHDSLQQAGLRTIDEVLAIPRDALARRFGPHFTDYLQRLLGERPDPRRRFRIRETYRRSFECSYPIDTAQTLLFPLRRILQELEGYLRGRDVAVNTVFIVLRHRDIPETTLELRMSAPQRDAARLFPVLREQLERTSLHAPVTHIVVKADKFLAPVYSQADLFAGEKAHDAEWSQLLDRLRARLGEEAIRELHLVDDFRPERAWCIEHSDFKEDPGNPLPERPVWLLDPQPLRHLPKLLGHPERIEAGWWENDDTRRDYYVAETPQGALWWVYRDGRTQEWFLHGIWA